MIYPVNDIYPSIQGEGVQTGVPMVVLRLQGCDVGCPWCDTKETWQLRPVSKRDTLPEVLGANYLWTNMHVDDLADYIADTYPQLKWVLVTGGEPATYQLAPLVNTLHDKGYKVALETSGTELGHEGAAFDWVCVSPKIGMPGGKIVLPAAVAPANEIKFVVGKKGDVEQISQLLKVWLGKAPLRPDVTVCLQPISQSKKATDISIEAVMRNSWRLSIQTHKYISIL